MVPALNQTLRNVFPPDRSSRLGVQPPSYVPPPPLVNGLDVYLAPEVNCTPFASMSTYNTSHTLIFAKKGVEKGLAILTR
jgi:hypothetical protein